MKMKNAVKVSKYVVFFSGEIKGKDNDDRHGSCP